MSDLTNKIRLSEISSDENNYSEPSNSPTLKN